MCVGKDSFAELVFLCGDAMATIQMMPGDSYSTFDSLASAYQHNLLVEFDKADTVFDVFDRYDDENSVKVGERELSYC